MSLTFAAMKLRVFLITSMAFTSVYLMIMFYLVYCQLLPTENFLTPYFVGNTNRYNQRHVDQRHIRHSDNCTEKRNFVFIKGMKCATSTLLGVFYRFGYTRNLSFVSPVNQSLWLNWPYPMTFRDFRPSRRGYNILTDHSIYTEDVMKAIMPEDTVYISIIREPFAQLKSLFRYFKIADKAGVASDVDNPVVEYFSHLKKYESAYQSPGNKARGCIPEGFSLTKNLMSHCHGMPLGFPPGTKNITNDTAAIEQYIQNLDSKFSLIMITEYFYESLILLRRLMCWSFRDIVFINSNVGNYSYKTAPVPDSILDLHRLWSNADYMLYRYFNNTFWSHVSNQGSDFYSEVETFKRFEYQVQDFCRQVYTGRKAHDYYTRRKDIDYSGNLSEIIFEETKWNKKFSISSDDCWMLGPNPYELLFLVQKENDVREADLLAEQKKIPDNRTMKARC